MAQGFDGFLLLLGAGWGCGVGCRAGDGAWFKCGLLCRPINMQIKILNSIKKQKYPSVDL